MSSEEYGDMTLNDLEIKYKGWTEIRQADLFDRWEQVRTLSYYNLFQPSYKVGNKGFDFKNPYSKKKKVKEVMISGKEVERRLKSWDKLK